MQERSAACFGEAGLLHASGLRYKVDLSSTAQEIQQNEDGEWSVVVPGDRVMSVGVEDAAGTWFRLDDDRAYRILSNSFLIEKGGDGYFWLGRYGRDTENIYSTFYTILEEIVSNEGVLNPEPPDGRLSVSSR